MAMIFFKEQITYNFIPENILFLQNQVSYILIFRVYNILTYTPLFLNLEVVLV